MPIPFSGAAAKVAASVTPDYRIAEHGAHKAIDGELAEFFLHYVVIAKPNYQAQPDPTIEPTQVFVVFTWESAEQRLGLAEERVDSRNPCIVADRYQFAHIPKHLDRLVRCLDGTVWEVSKVQPDGLSGLRLELLQLGTAY